MLQTLAIANYRSLLKLTIPLGRLNLITGANGSGKSNLYRALRLLAETAQGGVVNALAHEGGLDSTFWAGPETLSRAMQTGAVPIEGTVRQERLRLRLGFAGEDFGYAIALGLPTPPDLLSPVTPKSSMKAFGQAAIIAPPVHWWSATMPSSRCATDVNGQSFTNISAPSIACSAKLPTPAAPRKLCNCVKPSGAGVSMTISVAMRVRPPASRNLALSPRCCTMTGVTLRLLCKISTKLAMRKPCNKPLAMHSPVVTSVSSNKAVGVSRWNFTSTGCYDR